MSGWPPNQPVGELRPSQVLYTYGPGSIIELPHLAVLMLGLDFWEEHKLATVYEPRLLRAIRKQVGPQVKELRSLLPGHLATLNGTPGSPAPGVPLPVTTFPTWLRCTRCYALARVDQGLFEVKPDAYRSDRSKYVHRCFNSKFGNSVVPAPYLLACPRGHLDDFPWVEYTHKGSPCGAPSLRLQETSAGESIASVYVTCMNCNNRRSLQEAYGADAAVTLGSCKGRHPHLNRWDAESCPEQVRTILIGASNLWFPVNLSTLYLPTTEAQIDELVRQHWGLVGKITNVDRLQVYREDRLLPPSLSTFEDDKLLRAISKCREEAEATEDEGAEDLYTPEWDALTHPEDLTPHNDLQLRQVAIPAGFEGVIRQVVLIERLKEVRATIGFSRIEAPSEGGDSGVEGSVRTVPIGDDGPAWVPAAEVRGEGLFLQFREEAIIEWEGRPEVQALHEQFLKSHIEWRKRREIRPATDGFPGVRYVLLHSLSHALIRVLSLSAGYSTASLRERLYVTGPDHAGVPMAGILIYTSAPDSEGTLGGLIRLGSPENLGEMLEEIREQLQFCSADPLCAEHELVSEGDTIQGAACHACLYLPETSCERGNRYLDRSVLVETLKHDRDLRFLPN